MNLVADECEFSSTHQRAPLWTLMSLFKWRKFLPLVLSSFIHTIMLKYHHNLSKLILVESLLVISYNSLSKTLWFHMFKHNLATYKLEHYGFLLLFFSYSFWTLFSISFFPSTNAFSKWNTIVVLIGGNKDEYMDSFLLTLIWFLKYTELH